MDNNLPSSDHLRLLANLLAMPTEESIDVLREYAEHVPWLQPAVKELESYPLQHWQAEHGYLFINGQPKTACPPFQSVYIHDIMNGSVAREAERLYHQIGLEAIAGVPPDYLGMLLECAAYLRDQKPEDQPFPPELETIWLQLQNNHFIRWVPKFAADLQQAATLKLYQSLAQQLQMPFFTGKV